MFRQADERLHAIPTPEQFTETVQRLVTRYQLSYFDAIKELCDFHDREYDSIKPLLTPVLRLALLEEMSEKRLLKDRSFLRHKLG